MPTETGTVVLSVDRTADADPLAAAARRLSLVRAAVCKAVRQGDLPTANALLKAEDVAIADLRAALRRAGESGAL